MKLSSLERSELLLLLLFSQGKSGKTNEPIVGITRLMKLLFLLDKEKEVKQFTFEPYKMGPFSSEVYPELEFLQNFPSPVQPFIVTSSEGASVAEINPEIERILDEVSEEPIENYVDEVNKNFRLSDLGVKVANQIWTSLDEEERQKITEIKTKFSYLTLKDLLRYVYSKYPDMTVNSEIKNQL